MEKSKPKKDEHKYMWMIVAIVCVVGVVAMSLFLTGYTGEAYKSVAGEKKAVAQTPYAKLSTAMNSYFGNIGRTVNVDTIIKSSNAFLAVVASNTYITNNNKYAKLYSNMLKKKTSVANVVNNVLAGESDENIDKFAALIGVEISTLKANFYGMGDAAYTIGKPFNPTKTPMADKFNEMKMASDIFKAEQAALGGGGAPPAESEGTPSGGGGSPLQTVIDCVESLGGAMSAPMPGPTAGEPMPTGGVVAITGMGLYTGGGGGGIAPVMPSNEGVSGGAAGGPGMADCMGLEPGVAGGFVSDPVEDFLHADDTPTYLGETLKTGEGVDGKQIDKAVQDLINAGKQIHEVSASELPPDAAAYSVLGTDASGKVVTVDVYVNKDESQQQKIERVEHEMGHAILIGTKQYGPDNYKDKETMNKAHHDVFEETGVPVTPGTGTGAGYDIEGAGSSNPCSNLAAAIDTCFGSSDEEDFECGVTGAITLMFGTTPDPESLGCNLDDAVLNPEIFGTYYTDPMQFLTNAMTNLKSSSTLANYALSSTGVVEVTLTLEQTGTAKG